MPRDSATKFINVLLQQLLIALVIYIIAILFFSGFFYFLAEYTLLIDQWGFLYFLKLFCIILLPLLGIGYIRYKIIKKHNRDFDKNDY